MQVVKCVNCGEPLVNVDPRTHNVLPLDNQQYAVVDERLTVHRKTKAEPLFHINDRVNEPCPACGGTGKVTVLDPSANSDQCTMCRGTGTVSVGTPATCPNCGTINRIS